MDVPKLTKKQQEILKLLYRYRYLNRIQIQQLLRHKDYKTINVWLKDLREKQYAEWIYSDHFLERTKPGVYYLGLNGIRWLRQQAVSSDDGESYDAYPVEEVRKRYKDQSRSESFRMRSMLAADCCINLNRKISQEVRYGWQTPADYADPESNYNFFTNGEYPTPHLIIAKNKNGRYTYYLLEVFDATLPRYRMRTILKQYFAFLTDGEWESETELAGLPIVLIVCPRTTDLIYVKHKTKRLLDDLWDEEEAKRIHIRCTTLEQPKLHGITASIWEEKRKIYDV